MGESACFCDVCIFHKCNQASEEAALYISVFGATAPQFELKSEDEFLPVDMETSKYHLSA